ncbi:unnamed protein product [Owenia fusiformis]|uniref:Uncharacterized protein n=1 Tax=Owenia fusiformis TaxID=6347 RepID=A0A8J1TSH6_OWEFU|nr:unnamed protein product [Owenia fusiformis]
MPTLLSECFTVLLFSYLKPLYLLNRVAPDRHHLPRGMEIAYDDEYLLHAYRFTSSTQSIHFPANEIFTKCDFFPEEFSILATVKIPKTSNNRRDECIFSLVPTLSNNIKLGLRLTKDKIVLDYSDHKTSLDEKKTVAYKNKKLFDGGWHTIIITVSGNTVTLTTDCQKTRTKRIDRIFPALLSTKDSEFHVANCHGAKHFSGLIKQLLILPGSDASKRACPSKTPSIPDFKPPYDGSPGEDNNIPGSLTTPVAQCTWRTTGKLWYDVHSKTLRVCYSGIWQPILQPPEQKPKQLDYIEWYQDLITPAPAIDLDVFRIPGEGLFMTMANYNDSRKTNQASVVYKWTKGTFRMYQLLTTHGAQSWEHFRIGKMFFIAVANYGSSRNEQTSSVIYRWHSKTKRFRIHQEILTWTARDIEHFKIDKEHYIAVANHAKGQENKINSIIYKWDKKMRKFRSIQEIPTVAAYDWTHFVLDGYHFLVVANAFNGVTTRIDSTLYVWQSGQFVQFQTFETTGATDWEHFRIGYDHYLAVANAFNYGPQNFENRDTYTCNSTIYKLNRVKKQFERYQTILTHSAIDWESFRIGDDHYLALSNAQNEPENSPSEKTSVIYRWRGVEKFVEERKLYTFPSTDWETFRTGGITYLVYANAKENISQLYKARLI